MPVVKIPVVHKFGIISQSHRDELQERIQRNIYISNFKDGKSSKVSKDSLEVNEDFVNKFNNCANLDDKHKLLGTAKKMFERAKRRCGTSTGGSGKHVDLPLAWTELAQLAQCQHPIQSLCLNVLNESLQEAPFDGQQIPALFYLAETTLYWLRTDSLTQPYLRKNEILLLEIGMNTFFRLFYHYMAGELGGFNTFKDRLNTYLEGFIDSQNAYEPYPICVLRMKFIHEIGRMLTSDVSPEPEEDVTPTRDKEGTETTHKSPDYISSCVHDLSPTLWHSLDVWKSVEKASKDLRLSLTALLDCAWSMADENWVDVYTALNILGDAGKSHGDVLHCLFHMAKGPKNPIRKQPVKETRISIASGPQMDLNASAVADDGSVMTRAVTASTQQPDSNAGFSSWPWQCCLGYISILKDIVLKGSTSKLRKLALVGEEESLKDFSLLGLLFYNNESKVAWKVRSVAYEQVWNIYKYFEKDKMNDNLANAAWQAILHVQRYEMDRRVLDSSKIIQDFIPTILQKSLCGLIAKNLSNIYLPTADYDLPLKYKGKNSPKKVINKPMRVKQIRTSLRDEMNLANALYESLPGKLERMNFAMRRVVEDQWRKEEHELLEKLSKEEQEDKKPVEKDEKVHAASKLKQKVLNENFNDII